MNSPSTSLPPGTDEHVFLAGRPPIGEYLSFFTSQVVGGNQIPQGILVNEWRAANDHLKTLEKVEAGLADNPNVDNIAESQQALVKQVIENPMFQRSYQVVPTQFGLVNLDTLVVFQKYINLSYVRTIQTKLGKNPSEEDVFRFCFPIDQPTPQARFMQTAQNSYSFISSSNDLRFVEAKLFAPNEISYVPAGPVSSIIGLVVGYGANLLTALRVENRLILINGSHRAFALRDMGIKNVPCIVQNVSRREELEMLVQGEVSQKPDMYLKVPRPPLLKDYFDPALRKLVSVARKDRLVRVSFGVEQFDIPAS